MSCTYRTHICVMCTFDLFFVMHQQRLRITQEGILKHLGVSAFLLIIELPLIFVFMFLALHHSIEKSL